jgi:hypothetical protein
VCGSADRTNGEIGGRMDGHNVEPSRIRSRRFAFRRRFVQGGLIAKKKQCDAKKDQFLELSATQVNDLLVKIFDVHF